MRSGTRSWVSASRLRTLGTGLGVAFLFFLFANLLSFGYGRDQGIYAVVADAIVHGKAPYRDAWDFKPPGIFFLYAGTQVLLGARPIAIRIVETMAWLSVPFALARFTGRRSLPAHRNRLRFIGFAGGVLAVYLHVFKEFWHTAQPESFGAVLLVWAFVLTRSPRPLPTASPSKRGTRWFIAGILLAVAGLLKPPLFAPLPCLLLLEGFEEKTTGRRPWYEAFVAASVGAAIPLLLTLGYFASKGALRDLVSTLFVFAPKYTKLGFSIDLLPTYAREAFTDVTFRFTPFLAPWLFVCTALVPKAIRQAIDVPGILAFALPTLFGVALQAKFFPYHYNATLPFIALAAVGAYSALFCFLARLRVPALVNSAGVLLLAFMMAKIRPDMASIAHFWERVPARMHALMNPDRRDELLDAISSEGDVVASENRAVSNWIRQQTGVNDRLFLWGFEPVVYAMSERPRASRYLYNVPQRLEASRAEACATLEGDLRVTPPRTIAVERGDRFPWVTGSEDDSLESLSACPKFAERLEAFDVAWQSPKFVVYRERTATPPAPLEPQRPIEPRE